MGEETNLKDVFKQSGERGVARTYVWIGSLLPCRTEHFHCRDSSESTKLLYQASEINTF